MRLSQSGAQHLSAVRGRQWASELFFYLTNSINTFLSSDFSKDIAYGFKFHHLCKYEYKSQRPNAQLSTAFRNTSVVCSASLSWRKCTPEAEYFCPSTPVLKHLESRAIYEHIRRLPAEKHRSLPARGILRRRRTRSIPVMSVLYMACGRWQQAWAGWCYET